jgi:HAD superfamily hydrolase (TIGR01509 family)
VIVRAVTVDFWGTLLVDSPASDDRYRIRRLHAFETILAGAGVRVSAAVLDRAYEASSVYLSRIWAQHRDVPVADHVRAIVGGVDSALPARLPADVLAALIDAYATPALLVPPAVDDGAPKALSALREEGYTLAIVSNTMRTPGATLRRLLDRFGLLRHFAHTVFSDEVGIRKPDPAIFLGALRAIGCEPEAAIHVGDDGVLDVAGARAAGMRVIQVTGASIKALGARRPDAVIPSLSELPDAVARLGRERRRRPGAGTPPG